MVSCSADVRCLELELLLLLDDGDENFVCNGEDAYDDKRCPWLSALSNRAAVEVLLRERYGAALLAQEPDPLC